MKQHDLNNKPSSIRLDYEEVKISLQCLNALNHPARQKIIAYLEDYWEEGTPSNISDYLNLDLSIAQRHLATLSRANLIFAEKIASDTLIYHLNHTTLRKAAKLIAALGK